MILYKLINTPISNYLYNKNKICKINEQQYLALKEYETVIENEDSIKKDTRLDNLIKNGFLGDNPIVSIEHPDTQILNELVSNSMSQMTLQLTQNCNLRCSYCVYSGNYYNRQHNNKVMDFELAKNRIDYFFKHSSHSNDLAIGFYGGEPLLCFRFIKKCVEYAESTNPGKNLYFTITTNGTLLTKKVAEYFDNRNFHITLSLDGASKQHDINRRFVNGKGSFEVILKNLNRIIENHPDFAKKIMINTVITPQHDVDIHP
ncbi:radical SAM protein [Enterococcus gallinarum]|uniref:radical SAM protein n=1 Tax=Enterococcus gallinarum TaxID=1353 RepID=UPI00295562C3|nr:radical SAM protein [Enterococcus gallinarum]MDV7824209.1 radical SAM protein [Enterococcus gallinarum]MDY4073183.1 radical SAM protein [Enterococcus gallinarum]